VTLLSAFKIHYLLHLRFFKRRNRTALANHLSSFHRLYNCSHSLQAFVISHHSSFSLINYLLPLSSATVTSALRALCPRKCKQTLLRHSARIFCLATAVRPCPPAPSSCRSRLSLQVGLSDQALLVAAVSYLPPLQLLLSSIGFVSNVVNTNKQPHPKLSFFCAILATQTLSFFCAILATQTLSFFCTH
jgi:hypothetical protein